MSVTSAARRKEGGIAETVRVIFHALIISLVIRTCLFQPFNIPSGSMKATLLVGDYLFVSKYSYGYSHYSFPFSPPVFSGRFWAAPPDRGDVVVFRLPKDDSTDYIKRVIGLPNDRIQMIDGVLHINRQPRAQAGRLCPLREHCRSGSNHLFCDSRGRACVDALALALVDSMEPALHCRAMNRSQAQAIRDSNSSTAGTSSSPETQASDPNTAKQGNRLRIETEAVR